MTVLYASTRDVFDLGLTARAFVVVPRPLDARAGDSLDPTSGIFSLSGHGLDEDDVARIVLIARGGTNAIPTAAGLTERTPLYPLPIDFDTFKLSLSPGGAPLTFSDVGTVAANGSSAWGIRVDPLRRLEALIKAESADCDQCLIAHRTPIEPDPVTHLYPQKLVDIVARGAARRAIAGAMFENVATKIPQERLDATAEQDKATKALWSSGQPIYPTPVDQTDGRADNGGQATSRTVGRAACSVPVNWVKGYL